MIMMIWEAVWNGEIIRISRYKTIDILMGSYGHSNKI